MDINNYDFFKENCRDVFSLLCNTEDFSQREIAPLYVIL